MSSGAEKSPKNNRVLVAMSGGVDSSVAAALLVEQGYDVVGMTMQVWDYSSCDIEEGNGTCCSSVDVDDARSVADKLGIPFYVANCEAKFRSHVIDPFIQSYLQGQTPSPCVNCNTFLKFDHLIRKMKELDCQYLATGHYASLEKDSDGQARLVTSEDSWKDQTYFLFTLKPEILPHLLFPVGNMEKSEVRRYAEENGLINAKKKDSTGICFVGKNSYASFIEREAPVGTEFRAGEIKRYPSGEVLGHHQGVHRYTLGQRRGLGMDYHETLFVIKIDPETATVWVGDEEYLLKSETEIENCNWLDQWEDGEELRVKVRFHHAGAEAKLHYEDGKVRLKFKQPQRAITPGQAAVVYRGAQLIGGGWICPN